jgi:hypothetical protein
LNRIDTNIIGGGVKLFESIEKEKFSVKIVESINSPQWLILIIKAFTVLKVDLGK